MQSTTLLILFLANLLARHSGRYPRYRCFCWFVVDCWHWRLGAHVTPALARPFHFPFPLSLPHPFHFPFVQCVKGGLTVSTSSLYMSSVCRSCYCRASSVGPQLDWALNPRAWTYFQLDVITQSLIVSR